MNNNESSRVNRGIYNYKALCTRVIDGDTLICDIDLGFYIALKDQKVRLSRINSPEISTPEGIKSKEFLKSMIENKEITIKTKKAILSKEKYGRWLAEIFIDEENINDFLVENKHSKYV